MVGDIVLLRGGEKAPADLVMLAASNNACGVDTQRLNGEEIVEIKSAK